MNCFIVGMYHISVNGPYFDDSGAWNAISVYEFRGDNPLHGSRAVKHIFTKLSAEGIYDFLDSEARVKEMLRTGGTRFTPSATREYTPKLLARWQYDKEGYCAKN